MELQRVVTLLQLAHILYFLIKCICFVDMTMFVRFGEISAVNLQDIKETRCYGRTDRQTDAQTHAHTHEQFENSIPHRDSLQGQIKPFTGIFVCTYASIL